MYQSFMMKILLTGIFCIFLFVSNNFAQSVCGDGWYRVRVNTDEAVYYELFTLLPKNASLNDEKTIESVNRIFFPKAVDPKALNTGAKVENPIAENFLKNYKSADYEPVFYKLNLSGAAEKRLIKIQAAENYLMPVLLKLTSPGYKTVYYAGTLLGGCRIVQEVNLEKL